MFDSPDPDLPADGKVLSRRAERRILAIYVVTLAVLVLALTTAGTFGPSAPRVAVLVATAVPFTLIAVRTVTWSSYDKRGFVESVAVNLVALGAVIIEPMLWAPVVVLSALLVGANMATAGIRAAVIVIGIAGLVLLVEAIVLDVEEPLPMLLLLLLTPPILAGLESKRLVRRRRSYAVLYLRHGLVTGMLGDSDDLAHVVISDVNPAALAMFNAERHDLIGSRLIGALPWLHALDLEPRHAPIIPGPQKQRRRLPVGDGRVFDVDVSVLPNREIAFTFTDVSGQVEAEQTIRHQAEVDALSGLANRAVLISALDERLKGDRRRVRPFALLIIDLNRFKEINDTFGHHVGDAALRQIADELQGAARPTDIVARVGGDEFAVIVDQPDGPMNTIDIAERFAIACEKPVEVAGMRVVTGASIGVVLVPEDGNDSETIMRRADSAMYEAKRSGERVRVFTRASAHRDGDRLALSSQVDTAFARSEFVMLAQPKVNLRSGYVTGIELLARWDHPERGIIEPDEFIDLVELAGRSPELARIGLRKGIEGLASLGPDYQHDDAHVAVNLSPRDFADARLPAFVKMLLEDHGVAADRVFLEVTEHQVFDQLEGVEALLEALVGLGVRLSIDDFGTGHSHLLRLNYLPVAEIKLDKYFVDRLINEPEDTVMVRSVVELGHNLGLRVTAEGVENQRQAELLRRIGCDHAQGYLWGRPMPVDEALALIGTKIG